MLAAIGALFPFTTKPMAFPWRRLALRAIHVLLLLVHGQPLSFVWLSRSLATDGGFSFALFPCSIRVHPWLIRQIAHGKSVASPRLKKPLGFCFESPENQCEWTRMSTDSNGPDASGRRSRREHPHGWRESRVPFRFLFFAACENFPTAAGSGRPTLKKPIRQLLKSQGRSMAAGTEYVNS